MTFKETHPQFQMIDVALIEPDPANPRQHIDPTALKVLANSIRRKGLIHPLVVQPAAPGGKHVLIVGERRWRAAVMAGETAVPALIRACEPAEALEVRIFENLGMGVRVPLEPREMANALQAVADRFDNRAAAAEYFDGTPSWLNQATAAAAVNLSPKVAALLDSGKISSAGAAVKLEKLVQKNEAKADSLIGQIEQLPEGEKLARKTLDRALSEEGGRRRIQTDQIAVLATPASIPPWESSSVTPSPARINPGKMQMVAKILGLADSNEEEILARLVDEFLALKGEDAPPF